MSNVDIVWGMIYGGLVVSSMIYGVACGQCFRYFSTYTSDRRLTKATVFVVWLFASLQQCLFIHLVWRYVMPSVDPSNEDVGKWSTTVNFPKQLFISSPVQIETMPAEFVTLVVECFFVLKIRFVTHRKKTALLLIIPATSAFALRLAYAVASIHHPSLEGLQKWLLGTSAISRVVADLGIAVWMILILRQEKNFECSSRPYPKVLRVFDCLFATGLLNSILTLLTLVLYFAIPSSAVYGGLCFVHGKVYFNCMMASLNSREPPRRYVEPTFITSSDFS